MLPLSILSGIVLILFFLIAGDLREFFEAGGPVLWGILLVTMIMWTLIIERFWYFRNLMPALSNKALNQWNDISNKGDWFSMRIRDQIISEVSAETRKFILTIETMMQILPLLGLLGSGAKRNYGRGKTKDFEQSWRAGLTHQIFSIN